MGTQSILLVLLASFLVAVIHGAPVRSNTYIVHMKNNMSHGDVMAKGAWYSELMQGAKMMLSQDEEDDGRDCMHHVFDRVFNGFSARLTPAQASYMESLPGVLGLYPNKFHKISTTHSPEFLGLTATNARLWNESLSGEDRIIGVIDSGIWPERPSFSDELLGPIPQRWNGTCESGDAFNISHCNNKIIGARYFVLGYEAEYGPVDRTIEYRSPRDSNGHGTHCASTAAGRPSLHDGLAPGLATGMAPKARIAVYKALWQTEGTAFGATDDIVAAIDQAVIDGVDVISFSVSGFSQSSPLYDDPFGIAAYNAMKQGVFFSASAGNSGPAPFTIDHAAPWVTTVAASTQDREIDASVELGNGTRLSGRSTFDGQNQNNNTTFPLIYAGDAAIDPLYQHNASICADVIFLNASLLQGKIVMCDFSKTVTRLFDVLSVTGVAGVILANSVASGESLTLFGSYNAYAFTQVGYAARGRILSYISSTPSPTARLLPATTVLGVRPAPEVAEFSSRGPLSFSATQWLKPDISAPGVDILAAGVKQESFAFLSGTSMSCPHISGIAALLKSVHPNWSPGAIRSALMTTATALDNTLNTITTEETSRAGSPWEFGAGLTQPERAINPGLIYDTGPQDHFFFLCALGFTTAQIELFEPWPFTCPPQQRIEDLNLPSFVAVFNNQTALNRTAVAFARALTSVTSGVGTYNVTVEQPLGFNVTVEPAALTFSPTELLQRFTLTVTPLGTIDLPPLGVHGSIVWSDGVHVVRSPVTALIVNP